VRKGARNDKGAALSDEGRKAARGEKPLNEREPWTWLPDEKSRGTFRGENRREVEKA
jgi:hypothetical protein